MSYCGSDDSGMVFAMALHCGLGRLNTISVQSSARRGLLMCPVCLLVDFPKCVPWNISSESCATSQGFPVLVSLANSAGSPSHFWPVTTDIGRLKALRSATIKEPV